MMDGDTLPFYVPPPRHVDRLEDYVTAPPAAGSVVGSGLLRKTVDPTAWGVGNNVVVTPAGGAIALISLSIRVLVTLTSGGAATLAFDVGAGGILVPASALGVLTAGNMAGYDASLTNAGFSNPATNVKRDLVAMLTSSFGQGIGGILINSVANGGLRAVVGTAVFTAGSIEIVASYTPLTLGATLT